MPKASPSTLSTGAAHCAVEEPFETMRCSGRSASSLTPRTTVMSGGSAGATQRMTRRAPWSRWAWESWRCLVPPVASTT